MAGMTISTSGLDTASIIDQLMSIEANSQVLLRQKLTSQNKVVSALQGLNTRMASLQTNAAALAKPDAWTKVAATSSSPTVTVASTSAVGAGTLTFDVVQTAQKASYTSGVIADATAPTGAQTFTITGTAPGSAPVEITATSGKAADLATAINDADAGVVATTVRDADGSFRLLLTSETSGAAGDFAVTGAAPALTQLSAGRDASLDLGGGVVVNSPTNTFTDLMAGVSVTVTKAETGVTVAASADTAAVGKQLSGVMGSLGVVLSEMASQSRTTVGSAGPLAGSSLVRGLQSQLVEAVYTTVPGATMKDVGIELNRDGTFKFDEAAFTAFTAKEPDKAKALVTAFSTSLSTVAKNASQSSTGSISQAITSGESAVRDLTDRIEDWDVRLELRRSNLQRTYSALEVALNKSQSTASWLGGALAGLPGYSS